MRSRAGLFPVLNVAALDSNVNVAIGTDVGVVRVGALGVDTQALRFATRLGAAAGLVALFAAELLTFGRRDPETAPSALRQPCRSQLTLEPARTASRRLEAREKGEWT